MKPFGSKSRPLSNTEADRRAAQGEKSVEKSETHVGDYPSDTPDNRMKLLSRDDIQTEYGLSRRWLELAALSGGGPPFVKISSRMVRYQRGQFEDWLAARTVQSTSEEVDAR